MALPVTVKDKSCLGLRGPSSVEVLVAFRRTTTYICPGSGGCSDGWRIISLASRSDETTEISQPEKTLSSLMGMGWSFDPRGDVGVGLGVGVAVGKGVAVGYGVDVGVGTGVAVGYGVDVGVGTGVAVGYGVDIGSGTGVDVGIGVYVGAGVAVG